MPKVVILGGPNGAGKTTSSAMLLQGDLEVDAYVNADIIARGLAGKDTADAAIEAGRITLRRIDELAESNADFAFETTLASVSFRRRVCSWQAQGYVFVLLYLWLPSPDDSIRRVQDRVRRGGHHVPETDIRRRYRNGLRNFFRLYRPLADVWRFYNNFAQTGPKLIAWGNRTDETIVDGATWQLVRREVHNDSQEAS